MKTRPTQPNSFVGPSQDEFESVCSTVLGGGGTGMAAAWMPPLGTPLAPLAVSAMETSPHG